mgnify:CR=1 FL=1
MYALVFLMIFFVFSVAMVTSVCVDYILNASKTVRKMETQITDANGSLPEAVQALILKETNAILVSIDSSSVHEQLTNTDNVPDQAITATIIPGFAHAGLDEFYLQSSFSVNDTRIVLNYSLHALLESVEFIVKAIITVGTLVFLLGVLIIYRVSRKVTQPIVELAALVQEQDSEQIRLQRANVSLLEVNQLVMAYERLLDQVRQGVKREHQFISDAAHELKTPLAAISGHLQLIERRGHDHPEIIQKSLDYMNRDVRHMRRLSAQLLEWESTAQALETIDQVDLLALLGPITHRMRAIYPNQSIVQDMSKILVWGNENDLGEVLEILLDNACKYSSAQESVEISATMDDRYVFIHIRDQGIGIPDDQKGKIFDRFYRVDPSRTRSVPGTGMGLSIALERIERISGHIRVEDNAPCGSVFTLQVHKVIL